VAEASVLMRAFRALDQSYFTWRAGAYDPNMEDAVGDQAPPFPILDYSDHVVIGFIGGPLARTDATGTEVIGTSGTPVAIGTAVTTQSTDTELRDFREVSIFIYVSAKAGASTVEVQYQFAEKAAPAATEYGTQTAEDAPVSGVAAQNNYVATYDISGLTPPFTLGPFNVPVRGSKGRVGISADAGTSRLRDRFEDCLMHWYLAKLSVTEESIVPGTADYHGEVRPVTDTYPGGRIMKVLADNPEDGTCLCKWTGTPPMDWAKLTKEEAVEHFENRTGWEALGVD